ncbi:hypothetical protein Hanom_Chr04g00360431 [Helianthus anomalus]
MLFIRAHAGFRVCLARSLGKPYCRGLKPYHEVHYNTRLQHPATRQVININHITNSIVNAFKLNKMNDELCQTERKKNTYRVMEVGKTLSMVLAAIEIIHVAVFEDTGQNSHKKKPQRSHEPQHETNQRITDHQHT